MSDKISVGSAKDTNPLAPGDESSCSHSREESPTTALTVNANFEHSMESLLASDLSEEEVVGEDLPGTEEIVASDERSKKYSDIPSNCDVQKSQMEERRSERLSNGKRRSGDKKQKTRFSSHRERKISVSKRPTATKVSRL